jgi:GxxExxY protein
VPWFLHGKKLAPSRLRAFVFPKIPSSLKIIIKRMAANLSIHTEATAKEIVDIAYQIHAALGPGLLESVYEKCFCFELEQREIDYVRQQAVPIIYNDLKIEDGLRLDILVDNEIIIELKAHENHHPVWEAQLLSYLKLTRKHLGFLINFNVPLIKNGIKRMVL